MGMESNHSHYTSLCHIKSVHHYTFQRAVVLVTSEGSIVYIEADNLVVSLSNLTGNQIYG